MLGTEGWWYPAYELFSEQVSFLPLLKHCSSHEKSLRWQCGTAGKSLHGSCRSCCCPGSRKGSPTQQLRAGQAETHSSFPAGAAQQPFLRLCPGTTCLSKMLPYRARTRAVCAAATPLQSLGTNPSCTATGNKLNGAGCHGGQQRQTRDTAGTTEGQFICLIPSSTKPGNNHLPARDEKAVSERFGSAAPPLRMGPKVC